MSSVLHISLFIFVTTRPLSSQHYQKHLYNYLSLPYLVFCCQSSRVANVFHPPCILVYPCNTTATVITTGLIVHVKLSSPSTSRFLLPKFTRAPLEGLRPSALVEPIGGKQANERWMKTRLNSVNGGQVDSRIEWMCCKASSELLVYPDASL